MPDKEIAALVEALEGIRGMLAGHAGQPNFYGDVYKIADAALSRQDGGRQNAADRTRLASRAVGEAMQAVEQIGIITSGCAQTHGDPGGGLEMANGYASDAFQQLSVALAALTTPSDRASGQGDGAECPVSPLPSGRHQVDTSMESGPNNCFFCEQPMPHPPSDVVPGEQERAQ